jgi:phospholipid/cholesterol/gamma-HCH transport system substrate-binding protein
MFDMKKQLLWSKLKVGTVVTLALLVLFLTVFFAGGIEEMLTPKVELKAQIADVKGLRKGGAVWISGIEVGAVKEILLDPTHGTLLTMSVNKSAIGFVKKDSQASVLTIGLLGDKYVELSPGSPGAGPVQPGDIIGGTSQVDIEEMMKSGAASVQKVNEFMEKITDLVTKIDKGEGTASKLLRDPSVYDNLNETAKALSAMAKEITSGKGTLGRLITDPTLYDQAQSAASSVQDLSRKLSEGSDKLLATASSVEEFTKRLNSGSGTLHRLIEDPALYDNLKEASEQLSSILGRINNGEGLAGSLIGDEALARDLKDILQQIKELTLDIRERPTRYFKFSLF